jgi:hypothetical protein
LVIATLATMVEVDRLVEPVSSAAAGGMEPANRIAAIPPPKRMNITSNTLDGGIFPSFFDVSNRWQCG